MEYSMAFWVAVLAFICAICSIPMSGGRVKGPFVHIWRLVTLLLLIIAALLAMFQQT